MTPTAASPTAANSPLDAVLPKPHFTERHSRTVQAPTDAVWAAATSVTPAEIRLAGPLMALRSLPRLLTGRRQRPPRSDGASFLEVFEREGSVKVAFSLEVADIGGATRVTTETRVVGTDHHARRVFGRYWLIIRGPSGLIRRSWLAAIDRRARKGIDRSTT